MEDTTSKATTFESQNVSKKQKENIFSQPWNKSDVVLVVDDKEFHVHRSMLSMQSPVFDAMFNGSFKDSTQQKIELKDDKHEAMLPFLKLLYPPNMLDETTGKADINDQNILSIVQLADKYGAKNVVKQCFRELNDLEPENTMRLLPYAIRHQLPVEKVIGIIARHVSTDTLANFAPELDNEPVYSKALETKCHIYEDAVERANSALLHIIQKYVMSILPDWEQNFDLAQAQCPEHTHIIDFEDFSSARACEKCLEYYRIFFIEYVYPSSKHSRRHDPNSFIKANDLIQLLKVTEDIATSSQK